MICLGFIPDGTTLLGTGTCNLAIMFYRRNKNLQILVIDAICGFPKTTFWGTFRGEGTGIPLLVGSQSPLDSTARACLSHRDTRPWPQRTARNKMAFRKWWVSPQIIHLNRVFHYKSLFLEYHYFWKHPYAAW